MEKKISVASVTLPTFLGMTKGIITITLLMTTEHWNWVTRVKTWKKVKRDNAYYDSLTQEDIAWG